MSDLDILFFGRKDDFYSTNLLKFLEKKCKKIDKIWSDGRTSRIIKKIKKNYDYIICFRSHFLLKEKHIKLAKIGAINFHPGPPKYRGVGCINLAILDGEKNYGTTAHLINQKIDNGKILNVKYFNLKKNDDLEKILEKTHKCMFDQSKKILEKIFKDQKVLKSLVNKNKNIKWSKKLMTRIKLNNLYELNKNIKNDKLKQAIKALNYKSFKPYIKINGHKFVLD